MPLKLPDPKCPKCGNEILRWLRIARLQNGDSIKKYECHICNNTFQIREFIYNGNIKRININ